MPIPLLPLMLLGTGISAVSNLIGSKRASDVAKRNTNLTIAENKKQAELAYQRDLENISAMNKYNSPQSQMERFKEAKLNPNLIYQQGNPGNQSQLARYNAPRLEYNYLPVFKGSEFDAIKNLPLSYAQVKNQLAIGDINRAKATMEQALSKYADMLAKNKAYASMTEQQANEISYIIGQTKIQKLFDIKEDSTGRPYFELKPEYAKDFIQSIVDKWKQETTTLGKSQVDIQIKDQLLKNLSVIPWLQPLIQFLKLF